MIKNNAEQEYKTSLWFTEEERENLRIDYRIKEIVYDGYSPYQHIVIADTYDFGKALILDDAIQTTAADGFIYNEMITHVPICAHPSPKNILIIGGGDCGAVKEIAKYSHIENIDMVEIDEMVVAAAKKYLKEIAGTKEDSRINHIFADGVKYAKDCKKSYDIVIVDSSDPIGPAIKLFSPEFYNNIFKILNDDGIFVCQSESPIFYTSIMRKIYKTLQSIYNDVKLYTATVPTYPGGLWSFTIASKNEIVVKPERLVKGNQYINEEIINGCFCLPEFVKSSLR